MKCNRFWNGWEVSWNRTYAKNVPARQSAEDSTPSTARRLNAAEAVLRKSYRKSSASLAVKAALCGSSPWIMRRIRHRLAYWSGTINPWNRRYRKPAVSFACSRAIHSRLGFLLSSFWYSAMSMICAPIDSGWGYQIREPGQMPPLIPPIKTGYPRLLVELSVQQKTREAYAIAGFCKLMELIGT